MIPGKGYVNRGPDPRADGVVGSVLGWIQRAGAYYTTALPRELVHIRSGRLDAKLFWPPFGGVFWTKANGRYWSLRAGYRFDPNVGDGLNLSEPRHDPPGASFPDVIYKSDFDKLLYF